MSAPTLTPTGPDPEGPSLQRPGFGRPSPALLARADRGYARFLAPTTPAAPDDGDQDDAARQR
ncbi:hypothetical protein [Streptomyces sp. W4I9-2]|uniref:hypothetical protein n=1 Tax=Streptomyces sp. W4I9-2 TaxID=3042297 RepID=UPI00277E671A|nr:hypothetical protein [Streptomyces sp. W4I9-2]MDQ0700939.1 hypothetical protein [Streptomyces sp. W4I9-2]